VCGVDFTFPSRYGPSGSGDVDGPLVDEPSEKSDHLAPPGRASPWAWPVTAVNVRAGPNVFSHLDVASSGRSKTRKAAGGRADEGRRTTGRDPHVGLLFPGAHPLTPIRE